MGGVHSTQVDRRPDGRRARSIRLGVRGGCRAYEPHRRLNAAAPLRPVDHVTIERESWTRGNGLLIATVTFGNANRFALAPVIIACDILKQGAPQGSRGTLIPRIIPPGKTTVEGIEFTALERGLEGGRCKILSAERLWAVEPEVIDRIGQTDSGL